MFKLSEDRANEGNEQRLMNKALRHRAAVDSSTSTDSVEVLGVDSSGREWDAETGMYFYRARYYSPNLARFISEDPLRFGAGDVNFYRYVGNNPINFIDPLGLIVSVCFRQTSLGFGNHAYLWSTEPHSITGSQSCGLGNRSFTESGPNEDFCIEIENSDGIEQDILEMCIAERNTFNDFFPYANDCQSVAERSVNAVGTAIYPKNNPGRQGGIPGSNGPFGGFIGY